MLKSHSLLLAILVLSSLQIFSQSKRPLEFSDIMKFKQIKERSISDFGNWIAYTANPDRGDGELRILSTESDREYIFARGNKARFSSDERHLLFEEVDPFDPGNEEKKKKKIHKLVLVNLTSGDTTIYKNIKTSTFSNDGKWVALNHNQKQLPDSLSKEEKEKFKNTGSLLELISLTDSTRFSFEWITSFNFDSVSHYCAFARSDTSGKLNGLFRFSLESNAEEMIDTSMNSSYTSLSWKDASLAFLKSKIIDAEYFKSTVYCFNNELKLLTSDDFAEGYFIPHKSRLEWSADGRRLFFGMKKEIQTEETDEDSTDTDIYDYDFILEDKAVDVWHWNDPLIKTNERYVWKRKKKAMLKAVHHLDSGNSVLLTESSEMSLETNDNPDIALGRDPAPYNKLRTWEGRYNDYYIISLTDGTKKRAAEKLSERARISPDGTVSVYYKDGHWFMVENSTMKKTALTGTIEVPFYNEDHDYPSAPSSYGFGGWLDNGNGFLIYDKYDIWIFTSSGESRRATSGREKKLTHRIVVTDKEKRFFSEDETLLLTVYDNKRKTQNFASLDLSTNEIISLTGDAKKYRFVSKAKDADHLIFTRETYDEFPDLWFSEDMSLKNKRKLTSHDKQRDPFYWGSAELVKWNSLDGKPLEGVLIKPENFDDNRKYPVLVYYYRIFSHRVHEFNDMAVNHRPNFPYYSGKDYLVFLPDIKFDVGTPGFSATKCLVPGVQKLIDLGIADPQAIALHGHSWSGYQTAFVVTQTDIFACAVAGAPVSNMTSAYGGIRWGTGLARQFQYENTQSRLGGSLWEYPERYIENSPLFFADRINTPLLIMHGDVDEAVPWYQSIELYLAMRRLEKDCIFLQYFDEPHHPKKYSNKLDYSIRMNEFIDFHCKKTEAPEWIKSGIPYNGE